MQRYEEADDPISRPIRRRETTPARLMGQPVLLEPPSRQPTRSFRRVPAQPGILNGTGVPALYPPHPPYPAFHPGAAPQTGPMYYPPQPMQFITVQPQSAMHAPSLMGLSTTPLVGVPQVPSTPNADARNRASRSGSPSPPGAPRLAERGVRIRERERGPERERLSSPPRYVRRRPSDGYSSDEDIFIGRERIGRIGPPSDDGDDESEDYSSTTLYAYTPTHMSRAVSAQPSSYGDAESGGKDENDPGGSGGDGDGNGVIGGGDDPRKEPGRGPRLSHIFESQYSGDYVLGGPHGAKLAALPNSKVKVQPLFRWLNCTRSFMDFEDFSREVMRVQPYLTAAENKGVSDLLTRVRRKFVKTVQTAKGDSVRHMEPSCIQHTLPYDGISKAVGVPRRTVTWICLPYFSLENYSGLQGAPEKPSAFPIETLLQSKFSRVDKPRDMRQAVCQSKHTPNGLCFHVAQIWCLVLDNSFLFTYSRVAEELLRGDTSSLATRPIQDISNAKPRQVIAVSYQQTVKWCIPLEECQTWLKFLSHFRSFWPKRLQFFRRKQQVSADDWPKTWNIAKHVSETVVLEMTIRNPPQPPAAGVLGPKDIDASLEETGTTERQTQLPSQPENQPGPSRAAPEDPGSGQHSGHTPGKSKAAIPSKLSIFCCLVGVSHPDFDTIDEEALDDHLREVEDWILSSTSFSDRRVYTACPENTRDEVYGILETQGVELSNSNDGQRVWQRDYETKLDIFNAADVAFKFFFPPRVNIPTVPKFWGALKMIITDGGLTAPADGVGDPQPSGRPTIPKHAIRNMRSELRDLCRQILAFSEIFDHCGRREQAEVAVPKEIVQGWIHLLMSLIYLPKDYEKSDRIFDNAKKLIRDGVAIVVLSLSSKSLLDYSVVLPQEIFSLLSLKLLQDITVGKPDISECYDAAIKEMEADIASKPSDRSREYRINLLTEEVYAVQRIIDSQTSIFQSLLSFARAAGQDGRSGALLEPMPDGYLSSTRHPSKQRERVETVYVHDRTGTMYPSEYREAPRSYYVSQSHSRSRERQFEGEERSPYQYGDSPAYLTTSSPLAGFKLAATDTGGYRILMLTECLQFLAGRERDFSGFRDWASLLELKNSNRIETTKDRHDSAIYAFTIVTIVFLPLSAVASIFGMNTSDVRDMDNGQWIYWAVAVPVTAIVILLGLLWTGELGNILLWVQSFSRAQQAYRYLPDDIYYDDYRGQQLPPQPPMASPRRYPDGVVPMGEEERYTRTQYEL